MQVFFFFFQIKCWLSKSPYSPAPQTEADWTELLVCRVLQGRFWEHHCHVTGQPVTRSASVPWEKEFLGFIGFNDCLCVGATPSCGQNVRSFQRPSGHRALRLKFPGANQEQQLVQVEKPGRRGVKQHSCQYPARSWPSWKPEFEIPDPLFFLINSWIDLQNMICVMIGSEEEH